MAAAPDAATWGYYSFPEADAPFCFAAEQVCEADMAGSGDDWPMHLEFSPDGLSVLAQGSDRSTRVWGIPQTSFVHSSRPETPHGLGRAVRSVAGRDAIYPAAWHPSGTCFAVPSKQQPVALHSLCAVSPGEPGGVRAADDAQAKPVAVYVPFSDGDTLADVPADIGVLLRLGRPASTHQRTSFCFDSSSSLLLAGTTEAFTLAFELVSGREVLRLPSPDGLPAPLAQFHPRGIVLATASGARAEPGAGAWWNAEDSDGASSDASGSDAATCPASVRLFRSAFRWAA
ncbi:hypothetical protein FNF29_07414 [Cafeteria roenbergensis]|uniref:Uncharacterized protein n=1 Tax=Cafeteria roenbergensis TaxID=33653 RepID=A0A5A8C2S4_CAFRO|nr:hypothetical protein FNF29_07414 [Cafeteria roenbergensis]|eukprot:KAA0147346.1 hypothetical protein FNF29_07414 [Cafeteria roenbergensis]